MNHKLDSKIDATENSHPDQRPSRRVHFLPSLRSVSQWTRLASRSLHSRESRRVHRSDRVLRRGENSRGGHLNPCQSQHRAKRGDRLALVSNPAESTSFPRFARSVSGLAWLPVRFARGNPAESIGATESYEGARIVEAGFYQSQRRAERDDRLVSNPAESTSFPHFVQSVSGLVGFPFASLTGIPPSPSERPSFLPVAGLRCLSRVVSPSDYAGTAEEQGRIPGCVRSIPSPATSFCAERTVVVLLDDRRSVRKITGTGRQ
jgi:hypothetical protein